MFTIFFKKQISLGDYFLLEKDQLGQIDPFCSAYLQQEFVLRIELFQRVFKKQQVIAINKIYSLSYYMTFFVMQLIFYLNSDPAFFWRNLFKRVLISGCLVIFESHSMRGGDIAGCWFSILKDWKEKRPMIITITGLFCSFQSGETLSLITTTSRQFFLHQKFCLQAHHNPDFLHRD